MGKGSAEMRATSSAVAQAPISMQCPLCKRVRRENALRCDCGYEFNVFRAISRTAIADPPTSHYLRSIDRSLRTIRSVVITCAAVAVIALVAIFVSTKM